MDLSLAVFLAAVVFFTYRGYQRGFGASMSRILGLVAGYAAAILFTPSVANWLQGLGQLQGMLSYAVAGLGLFLGGGLVVGLVISLIAKLLPASPTLSTASSVGGATTGLVVGCVVGLALVWGIGFIRQLQPNAELEQQARTQPSSMQPLQTEDERSGSESLPQSEKIPSVIETFANKVAGGAVAMAVDAADVAPEVVQASRALVQAPGDTVQRMQRLFGSEDFKQLLADPRSQDLLQSGDVEALARSPLFQRLHENADMRALARATGLEAGDERALAGHLSDLWRRSQQVKQNPELQAILRDPEFQRQLQSGNPAALLTNPKMQELVKIVYAAGTEELAPGAATSVAVERDPDSQYGKPREETQVYRWVDSEGRVHFSDQQPEE